VQGQGSASSEDEVKAAFLFHFSQFVDWPEGTFKEVNSPIVYCTIGEDPFHGALDASVSGKRWGRALCRYNISSNWRKSDDGRFHLSEKASGNAWRLLRFKLQ
jgi:hypothetical protein